MKPVFRFCEDCKKRLPVGLFASSGQTFDGLSYRCTPCVDLRAAAVRATSKARRAGCNNSGAVAREARAEAKALQRSTGVAHHVDHIVPIVSPLVQSLNGANLQPALVFVGPLLPLVQGLHVPANLRAFDAGLNSAKRNHWWPDMPDHPELLAAKRRFDARAHKSRPVAPQSSASRPRAGARIFKPGDVSLFRRRTAVSASVVELPH